MSSPDPRNVARSRRAVRARRNGRQSSGPKTPAGKSAASSNAFRHGLYSRAALHPGEDPVAYATLRQSFEYEHPSLPVAVIGDLAAASWRLDRLHSIEVRLSGRPISLLRGVARYQGRWNRLFTKGLQNVLGERTSSERASRQLPLNQLNPANLGSFGQNRQSPSY